MEWLAAVVAGADGDTGLVEDGASVVRVHAIQIERNDACAELGVAGSVDGDIGHCGQALERVGRDLDLVAPDIGHVEPIQVVDGDTERDRVGNIRRSSVELLGQGRPGGAILVNLTDHAAAAEEWRHRLEQLAAAPESADAGWPEHLVA